jgi:hypothetical protein
MSADPNAIDLRQVRSFVVLAEALHFGKAATRLCLAQPSLTRQIQLNEANLRVAPFHRTQRHMHFTPAGQAFLEQDEAKGSVNLTDPFLRSRNASYPTTDQRKKENQMPTEDDKTSKKSIPGSWDFQAIQNVVTVGEMVAPTIDWKILSDEHENLK